MPTNKWIVEVTMLVRYTPMYPDEVPHIGFVDAVNLCEDDIQELTQMIIVEYSEVYNE